MTQSSDNEITTPAGTLGEVETIEIPNTTQQSSSLDNDFVDIPIIQPGIQPLLSTDENNFVCLVLDKTKNQFIPFFAEKWSYEKIEFTFVVFFRQTSDPLIRILCIGCICTTNTGALEKVTLMCQNQHSNVSGLIKITVIYITTGIPSEQYLDPQENQPITDILVGQQI